MSNINFKIDGNIISPKGGSVIFGSEASDDLLSIKTENDQTWEPYTLVYVEEDEDETIPASQITYTGGTNVTSKNVQGALQEVEQLIYDSVPSFSLETKTASAGDSSFVLSKTFSASAMMVFYNGLLLNNGVHYTFSNNTITLLDFVAEKKDILTVIGLASNGGNANTDATALIGEAY